MRPATSRRPPATVTITVDTTPPASPTLTATPATDLPLGSGQGTVVVAAQGAADTARVVVRRDGDVIYDGVAPGDLTDDGLRRRDDRTTTGAVAYDAAGNASIAAAATAETPDRTAPAAPPAPDGSGYPLRVTWPDDAGTTFTLERDGTAIARTTQSAVTDADAVDAAAPADAGRRRGERRDPERADACAGVPPPTAAPATATPSTARTRPATSGRTRPRPSSSRAAASPTTSCW